MSYKLKIKHTGILTEEHEEMNGLKDSVEETLKDFQDLETDKITFEVERIQK